MNSAIIKSRILLPSNEIDKTKWSVIACDQYAAQPDYWKKVESIVGSSPSTLRMTLPEIYLSESKSRSPKIHAAMNKYLNDGNLLPAVDGFILVERETSSGIRPGIVAAIDLDQYDYAAGSASAIRPAENTIPDRVPILARIRDGAPLELPHALVLIEDPGQTVIESLYARRQALRPLYDFDLMMDAGHIRGWAIEDANADSLLRALNAITALSQAPAFLVGDGNHALAAAKQCWENVRAALPPKMREDHPMRYALVELVNVANPAIEFEPVHRLVTGVNSIHMITEFRNHLKRFGIPDVAGNDLTVLTRSARMSFGFEKHPLPVLQSFLDDYLAEHTEAHIEYIHGSDTLLRLLSERADAMGFMPRVFGKFELFPTVRRLGTLPRKTFSMGEANDKRFYLEARALQ